MDVPGYAALLLRRTYPDLALPGALMDRAHDWLCGTDAQWNDKARQWAFPSGAVLQFGYLEHEKDKYRYKSAEFQFVGFDELTGFSETQYRYLFSRLRRLKTANVPIRMRAASNPGDVGHEWVKARFHLAEPDPRRRAGMNVAADRAFIPAQLDDNPHLDRDEYASALAKLDHVTRRQLRHGDWDIRAEGGLFRRVWFPIIVDAQAPADARRIRYWDLAATVAEPGSDPDWTAGARLADHGGRCMIEDIRRDRLGPYEVEQLIRQTAALDGPGVEIWIEQEPGASGKTVIAYYQRALRGYAVRGEPASGNKLTRARPLSAAAEGGGVVLLRGAWNAVFLDEVEAFPSPGVHDDQVDAVSGAYAKLTLGPRAVQRRLPGY